MKRINKPITSWDDGSPYDLKLAELLDRYKIPGIFYIPITNSEWKVMTKSQICFPKGKYNKGVEEIVKKAGFKSARTARIFCMNSNNNGFLENPNLHVYNHRTITYLASCAKKYGFKIFSFCFKDQPVRIFECGKEILQTRFAYLGS